MLASKAAGGESGIRTRGPRFRRHIISNDAHSATLPSLRSPHVPDWIPETTLRLPEAKSRQSGTPNPVSRTLATHYNPIRSERKFSRIGGKLPPIRAVCRQQYQSHVTAGPPADRLRFIIAVQTDLRRIWSDLEWLASVPRPAESLRLEECRQYCEHELKRAGWLVTRAGFTAENPDLRRRSGVNLVARHAEVLHEPDRPIFVLGAHLDSCQETPGADDNASAVAVLLEMARCLPAEELSAFTSAPELVVFDLEESGMLGAAHHAGDCRAAGRQLTGMVSLEMLGYCDQLRGSQTLPEELAGQYPDTGNFIAVVGNQISDDLIGWFAQGCRSVNGLPVEHLRIPDNGHPFPPTRLSDHSPFWDAGYPALMITDTSFLRNPHYHEPTDTIDTLDGDFLHKVAEGVLNGVRMTCQRARKT